MSLAQILVVDDDAGFRSLILDILSEEGYTLIEAGTAEEALKILATQKIDLILSDQRMPGMDGLEMARRVKAVSPSPAIILMTAFGTIPDAVEAVRLGAADYLTKPLKSPGVLRALVARTLGIAPARKTPAAREFISRDPKVLEMLNVADRAAGTSASVLIIGESGTGKELLARRIHDRSSRSAEALVAVNCASIPEHLAESEFFGHEKGAFTGATQRRIGRFEQAHGGTLFLDEIGELPEAMQAKLLRALEERKIERLGGSRPISVDIRLISATNRRLEAEVEAGRFRADLLYRIDVVRLNIPPLRERPGDLDLLVDHLLQDLASSLGIPPKRLEEPAMVSLRRATWAGNVRELRNVLERALIVATGPEVRVDDLGLENRRPSPQEDASHTLNLAEREKRAILEALEQSDGHREKAAAILGISVRTLYHRLRDYDIRG